MVLSVFVYGLLLVLIIADCITGRKDNHLIVICNSLVVAGLSVLPGYVAVGTYGGQFLVVWFYLCLRLALSKYKFLRQETGQLGVKGAGTLFGYAIFYNIITLLPVLFYLFLTVATVGTVGAIYAGFVAAPVLFAGLIHLLSGSPVVFLEALGITAGIGGMAILIGLLFGLLIGAFLFLFLAVPVLQGIRGLKHCRQDLGLPPLKLVGYLLLLCVPYINLIPLIKLKRRCRRLLRGGGAE